MGGRKEKRRRGLWGFISGVKNWQIVLLFIPLAFFAATMLRFEHLHMTELKDEILAADTAGEDEILSQKLTELRKFANTHIIISEVIENGKSHIVFGTGAFYLEGSYRRKAQEILDQTIAEQEQTHGATNPNGNVYKKAAEYCDDWGRKNGYDYPSTPYIDCYQRQLALYSTSEELENIVTASLPETELYRFDFFSPYWYPCASGFVILACVILLFWFLIRCFIWLSFFAMFNFAEGKTTKSH